MSSPGIDPVYEVRPRARLRTLKPALKALADSADALRNSLNLASPCCFAHSQSSKNTGRSTPDSFDRIAPSRAGIVKDVVEMFTVGEVAGWAGCVGGAVGVAAELGTIVSLQAPLLTAPSSAPCTSCSLRAYSLAQQGC